MSLLLLLLSVPLAPVLVIWLLAIATALAEAIHSAGGVDKKFVRTVLQDIPITDMGVAEGRTAKAAGRGSKAVTMNPELGKQITSSL
jgi:hypothetical protein